MHAACPLTVELPLMVPLLLRVRLTGELPLPVAADPLYDPATLMRDAAVS